MKATGSFKLRHRGTRGGNPGRGISIRNPRAASFHDGFTLLEVMIALAIIAISLVTLLSLANRSIGVNDRLQKITRATLLAQGKMSELEVAAQDGALEAQEAEGFFDPPYDGYRWRLLFQDTPLPSVREATVTVAWGDESKEEKVDLSSFLFREGG